VKSHAFLSGIIEMGTGEGHVQISSVPFFGLQIISDANKTIFHTATMDPDVVKNDEMKRARVCHCASVSGFSHRLFATSGWILI
jgi:hypothetical protein